MSETIITVEHILKSTKPFTAEEKLTIMLAVSTYEDVITKAMSRIDTLETALSSVLEGLKDAANKAEEALPDTMDRDVDTHLTIAELQEAGYSVVASANGGWRACRFASLITRRPSVNETAAWRECKLHYIRMGRSYVG